MNEDSPLPNLTEARLRDIVARSSSLWERLRAEPQAGGVSDSCLADEQIERWRQLLGSTEQLRKRWRWSGWNIAAIHDALLPPPPIDAQPAWSEIIREICNTTESFVAEPDSIERLSLDPRNALPFEDLLLSCLRVARHRLERRRGDGASFVAERVIHRLGHSLLRDLVNVAGKTLDLEFSKERPADEALLLAFAGSSIRPTQVRYRKFVQRVHRNGFVPLFERYPVLARLLAQVIQYWIDSSYEFLVRLETDAPMLQEEFAQRTDCVWRVVDVEPSLSDPHEGRRSVIAVHFGSGDRVVYKPKSLELDVVFNRLIEWCNANGASPSLRAVKTIDRGSYGWVEYAASQPCHDGEEARRFYQRAGMLTALLHALQATDCHRENIIAHGEHPILIDAETIAQPDPVPMDGVDETDRAFYRLPQFFDSVIRTGLLPRWEFNLAEKVPYDVSGLGSIDPQPAPLRVPRFHAVNTDEMRIVHERVTMPLMGNIPILDGRPLEPCAYVAEIQAGFESIYRLLMKNRETLLDRAGVLSALRGTHVRFLFRSTGIYQSVLNRSFEPICLMDGAARSVQIDAISRAFLVVPESPVAWPILDAEIAALERFDVPCFRTPIESARFTVDAKTSIEGYFESSAYERMSQAILSMDEPSLVLQLMIIKASFQARIAHVVRQEPSRNPTLEWLDDSKSTNLRDELLDEAVHIGSEILNTAVRDARGGVTWMSIGHVAEVDRFQVQPLGEALYEGKAGVALFLATLDAAVGGNTQFAGVALESAASFRGAERHRDALWAETAGHLGLGGIEGLSSIVYVLNRMSSLLRDDALLKDALYLTRFISQEAIQRNANCDVMSGAAGAILALLSLYRSVADPLLIAKATQCGWQLVKAGQARRLLTGFSHGAAGVAYALLQLYAITAIEDFKEAAVACISYENEFFFPAASNWSDLRGDETEVTESRYMTSWCRGAAGIGLARIAGLAILDTPEIRNDIAAALHATAAHSLNDVDHLCCGNFGRIELLLSAVERQGVDDWAALADEQVRLIIEGARVSGGYRLFRNLPRSAINPGFFRGLSGIGYSLLRMRDPHHVPSVLLMM